MVLGFLCLSTAWAQEELFVANVHNDSITVYARTASGNTAPLRTLAGPATGLSAPAAPAVDLAHNELFVTNVRNDSITVYARTASGNTAPLRTLAGPATGLKNVARAVVDVVNNELFVVNGGSTATITVYARTASGNTAPLRTLTGLSNPSNIVLDVLNNEIFVWNRGNGSLTVYGRTASGNAAPIRTFAGPATGLTGELVTGVAVDVANNELFVATEVFLGFGTDAVRVYPRTASGNTAPLRTLIGAATGLNVCDIAVDATNNELVVANCANFVTAFARTASGNASPVRLLFGAATGFSEPFGVAITPRATTPVLSVNQSTFAAGQTLSATVGLFDPGLAGAADLYLGIVRPDGTIQFFTGGGVAIGSLANLGSFQPLVSGLSLATPFSVRVPGFYTYQWTGAESHGGYELFLLVLKAGALTSGLTADALLGLATAPYSFP